MELHPKIRFVGDQPNERKSLHPDIPFVGTKSYKTLLEWIYRLDVDISNAELTTINTIPTDTPTRLIAIGETVSNKLKAIGLKHQMLPHPDQAPSDSRELARILYRCKKFIHQK